MYDQHTDDEQGQTLTCVDCKAPFPFSNGELSFYQGKGLQIPKRCKACRIAKKARLAGGNKQTESRVDVQDDGLGAL